MLMAVLNLPKFTGPTARPDERMHWVRVPFSAVMELFNSPVLRVQRNHERRALRAKHIAKLNLPVHYNFMAGRTPDGQLHLLDGYTRLTILKRSGKPCPPYAWLGVIDVDSKADLDVYYDTIDSKQPLKRGRDAYEAGLRKAHLLDKLMSTLFIRAQVVTAIVTAAGQSDVRRATYELRNAIRVLDRMQLADGPGRLPQGALAALLLIAHRGGDAELLHRFAVVLERPDDAAPAERKALAPAVDAARSLQKRRELGSLSGKNVPTIMAEVLGAWVALERGTHSHTPISRTEFLDLENDT